MRTMDLLRSSEEFRGKEQRAEDPAPRMELQARVLSPELQAAWESNGAVLTSLSELGLTESSIPSEINRAAAHFGLRGFRGDEISSGIETAKEFGGVCQVAVEEPHLVSVPIVFDGQVSYFSQGINKGDPKKPAKEKQIRSSGHRFPAESLWLFVKGPPEKGEESMIR